MGGILESVEAGAQNWDYPTDIRDLASRNWPYPSEANTGERRFCPYSGFVTRGPHDLSLYDSRKRTRALENIEKGVAKNGTPVDISKAYTAAVEFFRYNPKLSDLQIKEAIRILEDWFFKPVS
ncbi:MAG: hypothetical protein ACP5E4_02540 [Candidatus Aenigmatarchaeota archaeon]